MATKIEFKDVAHLYLGCEVSYKAGIHSGIEKFTAVDYEGVKIFGGDLWIIYRYVKPILRHISSLTEDEIIDLVLIQLNAPEWVLQGNNFETIERDEISVTVLPFEDHVISAEVRCRCLEATLFFADNGDISGKSEEGPQMPVVNISQTVAYLLSKGFDLFNLIGSGQAIDKSTL